MTQLYLSAKSRFCGFGIVVLFHGWCLSIGLPSGSSRDERLLVLPVLEVRAAEQDADHQVDLDEVGRDELAVDRDARA